METIGAIDIETKSYTLPINACRRKNYLCFSCDEVVRVARGDINKPHYRHLPSSTCLLKKITNINNVGESDLHKLGKKIIKHMIETNKPMIKRECPRCNDKYNIDYEYDENCTIEFEKSFDFNGDVRIADVVIMKDNNIVQIIEIYNTHYTKEEDRPEPWVEFDVKNIINKPSSLQCVRQKYCYGCIVEIEQEQERKEIKRIEQERMEIKRIERKRKEQERMEIKRIDPEYEKREFKKYLLEIEECIDDMGFPNDQRYALSLYDYT